MYYEIVPMDRSHIPQIAALERECFSDPWSERLLEDALFDTQACFIVAQDSEEEGNVLGYAGLHAVLDEGYIDNVAVAPDARRHGVASALLTCSAGLGRSIWPSLPWRCASPTPPPSLCMRSTVFSRLDCVRATISTPGRTR